MDSNIWRAMPHSDVVPGVIVGPWLVRERWDHGSFGVVFRVERAGHPEAGSIHQGAAELTDGPLGPGTSAYRSPESLRWSWAHRLDGERYEPKGTDDVYALGVTAYRLCTGTYLLPSRKLRAHRAGSFPRRISPR